MTAERLGGWSKVEAFRPTYYARAGVASYETLRNHGRFREDWFLRLPWEVMKYPVYYVNIKAIPAFPRQWKEFSA